MKKNISHANKNPEGVSANQCGTFSSGCSRMLPIDSFLSDSEWNSVNQGQFYTFSSISSVAYK